MNAHSSLSAIVLAGGRGSRLGADKARVVVGGETLLARVVAAVRGGTAASEIIVAGPAAVVPAGCIGVREEPAYGGPLAALAAALPLVTADRVLVLACDLVRPTAVVALLTDTNFNAGEAVVLKDPDGRPQWLAGAYSVETLRAAVAVVEAREGSVADLPLRAVTAGLDVRWVDASEAVTADIDTPADLAAAHQAVDVERTAPTEGVDSARQ
ncbi:NTP transferase domain-containing protein [Leucobacter sp. cx-42]|uniref:molybdenum cofactor guanylyltransferase n=1 Tax=unclassified Leucobacter TaxID=2621730 RepID=UPI00165DF995|nr:NTP transferase domain-containing protein [Leucobacter sp. cx-42]